MNKRKIFIIFSIIVLLVGFTGCNKKNNDNKKFKEDYESLNNTKTSKGVERRNVNISDENPFIYSDASEIVKKIENKETFYVYFGSSLCPWCRSVIETMIDVALSYGIDKIYYVDVWDSNGEEILRDKYALDDNGNTKKLVDGTSEYFKLLEYFKDLLPDYTYAANKNGGSKLDVLEKRIYLPSLMYVKNGVALRMTDGLSSNQTSSNQELTEEILADEKEKFEDFFTEFCDSSC